MIVDTSAVLAVLFAESDAERYERAIAAAARCRMSAANFFEASMVVESRAGAAGGDDLDYFMERGPIELEPVTAAQAHAARRAWRRFGKGNHPAGLNFGDCFAYALAEITREPLLFKGGDFARTDVEIWEGELIPIRSDYAANHMIGPRPSFRRRPESRESDQREYGGITRNWYKLTRSVPDSIWMFSCAMSPETTVSRQQ